MDWDLDLKSADEIHQALDDMPFQHLHYYVPDSKGIQELLPMHLRKPTSSDIFAFEIVGLPGSPIDYQPDVLINEPMGYHMTINDEVIQFTYYSFLKRGCDPIYLGKWIPIEGAILPHDILESLNALHDE